MDNQKGYVVKDTSRTFSSANPKIPVAAPKLLSSNMHSLSILQKKHTPLNNQI